MKKLLLTALMIVTAAAQAFANCDVTLDGQLVCRYAIVDFGGIPEPSVSPSGSGRMYYDQSAQDWYCSKDGSSYALCFSGGGGGGTVTIKYDGVSQMTSTFTINYSSDYWVQNESPTNQWNPTPKDLWVFNTGDTMTGTLHLTAPATFRGDTFTASRVLIAGTGKDIETSSVTSTELGYLSGVTSGIQSQIDGKQAASSNLDIYAGIAPSANVQAILSAANYAAIRTLLDLEAGTDFYSISAADAAHVNVTGDTMTGNLKVDAAVAIGTQTDPEASIILDLSASDKALRVTRLANPAANIAQPRNGMIAYDSTDDQLQAYINGTWTNIGGAGGSTAWDNIGDPSTSATIAFGGTQQTITTTLDDATSGTEAALTIKSTVADQGQFMTLLRLLHTDDNDLNSIFLQMQDNGGDDVVTFFPPDEGSIPAIMNVVIDNATLSGEVPGLRVAYETDGDTDQVPFRYLDNSQSDIKTQVWGDGLLFTSGLFVLGSETLSSGTCAGQTSDRWFGDKDCDGTKDAGEEFFDQADAGGFGFTIDNNGSVITTTGTVGVGQIAPRDCTISAATMLADVSGSINVAVYKNTYSGYPAMTEISASADMNLTSEVKSQDSTLTGWTTTVTAGDVIEFYITATPSTVTAVSGFIECQ